MKTSLLAAVALLAATLPVQAQTVTQSQRTDLAPFKTGTPPALSNETFRLWTGLAPLATADTPFQTPTITVVRPERGTANGTAVVIAPGGGYIGLASGLEGLQPAEWFASRGITAFVLTYRTRPAAELPAPLLDGARAIRFVRANAAVLAIDPRRIGLMGFSAGGHLAASVASNSTPGDPTASDPIEQVSSRPDFLILAYPWLEATKLTARSSSSYCDFAKAIRAQCTPAAFVLFDPLSRPLRDMPPTFIYHTSDDKLVSVRGSLEFYRAMLDAGVDTEFHGFASGPHGSGLGGGTNSAVGHWPELLDEWLRAHSLLGQARSAQSASHR